MSTKNSFSTAEAGIFGLFFPLFGGARSKYGRVRNDTSVFFSAVIHINNSITSINCTRLKKQLYVKRKKCHKDHLNHKQQQKSTLYSTISLISDDYI